MIEKEEKSFKLDVSEPIQRKTFPSIKGKKERES
jgi:hypothetical protein